MALFARSRERVQLDRGGPIVAEHGPEGPPRSMTYPNERAAAHIFRKRVVELLADRWQLVRPDSDIGAPVAADVGREAELRASGDPSELAVYTDWLIDRGDPCGELAALRRRRDPALAQAISDFELAQGYPLFGAWADWLLARPRCAQRVNLLWSASGWIEGIELHPPPPSGGAVARPPKFAPCTQSDATLAALVLHAPMARFVRRLVVLGASQLWTLQSAIEHAARRDTIRELVVADPSMAELATVLPNLEQLTMPSDAGTKVGHARVRELTILAHTGSLDLVTGQWPAVERLTIRYAGDAAALEPSLIRLRLARLPHLRELQLDASFDDDTLARLAKLVHGFELHEAKP